MLLPGAMETIRPKLLLRAMSESMILLQLRSVMSVACVNTETHVNHVCCGPRVMLSWTLPSLALGELATMATKTRELTPPLIGELPPTPHLEKLVLPLTKGDGKLAPPLT